MAKTDILPGYTFGRDTHRYRDVATGRFVARSTIVQLLGDSVRQAEQRMHELTTAAHEGRLTPEAFNAQMRVEAKNLVLQNAALAAGGFDQLTQSDYGRAGAALRGMYERIAGTAADIADSKVSLPQALNRANGYAGDARRIFFQVEREHRPAGDGQAVLLERRILAADAEHCADCVDYYEQGWQIAGTLPVPGEACKCGGNCRCGVIEREVPYDEVGEWLGSKRA